MAAGPLRTAALRTTAHSLSSTHTSSPIHVRQLTSLSHARAQVQPVTHPVGGVQDFPPPLPAVDIPPQPFTEQLPPSPPPPPLRPRLRSRELSRPFFDSTNTARWASQESGQSSDPNKAKLGKTLRILQERMPTLLQSPLPQEILAPNISLHLFPSTHPHLPTVSGRVAYTAALWSSPIAWNRVPIIGNVRLEVLAERVTSEPLTFLPRRPGALPEQLVVRWCDKVKNSSGGGGGAVATTLARSLRRDGVDPDKVFTGLFIFDFDAEGRVLSHTIERAQESGDWEKGVGAKFVGLTDWLLGGMRDPGGAPVPMFERLRRRE